jgi:hypothetical protein
MYARVGHQDGFSLRAFMMNSKVLQSRLGETHAYALMPRPETGKISCVRLPCYDRLLPRQQANNAARGHKVSSEIL